MNKRILPALISPEVTMYQALKAISVSPTRGGPAGIAVVVDIDNKLLGILTDGDIRQLVLNKADLNQPVSKYMNSNPITSQKGLTSSEVIRTLLNALRKRDNKSGRSTPSKLCDLSKFIVLDGGHVEDIVSPVELFQSHNVLQKSVCVLGLGYVGLTLAAVLADEKFYVMGIDTDPTVRRCLKDSTAHFFENGLDPIIKRYNGTLFNVADKIEDQSYDIYIIAVGTPVDKNNIPQLEEIKEVLMQVASVLKHDDLVVLRSTVPPGSCRKVAIPILEEISQLKAGQDFHFVFAPERTLEGKALQELRSLPQVIGGITQECVNMASNFFSVFAPTIIRVQSLEAAELVKLINNTFRDVSFAYSNQIALLCHKLGVDTVTTINAANKGYIRSSVPVPSPGVGGSCLKKDPFILLNTAKELGIDLNLLRNGRETNEFMIIHIAEMVFNFFIEHKIPLNAKIFLIGIAFKGEPETSDVRNSTSLDLIECLSSMKMSNVVVYDPVVTNEMLEDVKLKPTTVQEGFRGAYATLIMNNHLSYLKFNIFELLEFMEKPGIFFDGWHMFQQNDIESASGIFYQGLGTKRDDSDID